MNTEEFYNKRDLNKNKEENKSLPDGAKKVLAAITKLFPKKFLDIGCGDIFLSKNILKECKIEEYHGIDISGAGVLAAKELGIKAIKLNIDEESLLYEDSYFDMVLAGELIEHLFNPDHLLSQVYRVLKKGGYFILTTPNLASWHNRIALLLGYQPHYSEVSTKYNIGKLMATNKNDVSGHLRLFTLRALRQLLELYNYKIIKILGYATDMFIDKHIFSHMSSLATGLIIISQKNV